MPLPNYADATLWVAPPLPQVTSEMFTEENEFIIQDEGLSQEEKRKYIFLCAEGNKPLKIEEYDSIS